MAPSILHPLLIFTNKEWPQRPETFETFDLSDLCENYTLCVKLHTCVSLQPNWLTTTMCWLCSAHLTLRCAPWNVQCAVCSAQCAVCSVQCGKSNSLELLSNYFKPFPPSLSHNSRTEQSPLRGWGWSWWPFWNMFQLELPDFLKYELCPPMQVLNIYIRHYIYIRHSSSCSLLLHFDQWCCLFIHFIHFDGCWGLGALGCTSPRRNTGETDEVKAFFAV